MRPLLRLLLALLLAPAARAGEIVVEPAGGAITVADGSLAVLFTVPALPLGLDAQRIFAQRIFAGTDGVTLGSGSASCWIAAGVQGRNRIEVRAGSTRSRTGGASVSRPRPCRGQRGAA